MYRLDRSAFARNTAQQADDHTTYWLSKTPAERLQAGWYLTCIAWGIDPQYPPRLDRTCFSMRKRGDSDC